MASHMPQLSQRLLGTLLLSPCPLTSRCRQTCTTATSPANFQAPGTTEGSLSAMSLRRYVRITAAGANLLLYILQNHLHRLSFQQ